MIWSPVLQVPTNNVGFSQVISCGEQFGRVRTEITTWPPCASSSMPIPPR